ncbi:MAG: M1 family metallopeptidase [Deltaproteobacteria bacterium]|nr:M1 family metallopeptidase [Deltaproteobacteria bacterium]
MIRILTTSLLIWALLPVRPTQAQTSPLPDRLGAPKPYDARPFMRALGKHYRSKMQQRMGIASLNDLPLYQMELSLDAVRGRLTAHQEITYTNTRAQALGDILLRTHPNAPNIASRDGEPRLAFKSVTVNGLPAEIQPVDPTLHRVPLARPLNRGQRVRVGMDYELVIPKLPASAVNPAMAMAPSEMLKQFKSDSAPLGYGIFGRMAGMVNLGFFYPILPARGPDGDWDSGQPGAMGDVAHFDVANYMVKLSVANPTVVVSSGIQVGEKPLGSGADAVKEVYLLGAALRNFAIQCSTRYVKVEKKVGDVNVRYFHLEEHADKAKDVLGYATHSLATYQRAFGPYAYTELDVVEAPLVGGAGGMEYPGMVTVATVLAGGPTGNAMLDLMMEMMNQAQALEFVVAHEVSHQWWHALVGSDSSRHPFLDESLANYTTVLYFEDRYGQQSAATQIHFQLLLPYQYHLALGGRDGQVARSTSQFTNQLEYTALVYGKGALYLHALRMLMGHKAFRSRLAAYAHEHAFRQAGPEDFLAAMARGSKAKKVRALSQRWLYEAHADEDIPKLLPQATVGDLMGFLQQIQASQQGFHNIKYEQVDPATMELMRRAVKSIMGQ